MEYIEFSLKVCVKIHIIYICVCVCVCARTRVCVCERAHACVCQGKKKKGIFKVYINLKTNEKLMVNN